MDGGWSLRIKAGWLLLTTALSGVVALEVTGHMPLHLAMPPAPAARAPDERQVLQPLQPPALEAIDDMLDRPLFVMSRRPAAAPDRNPSEEVRQGKLSDVLQLIGTIHTEINRLALFRHHERGMVRRRLGEEIDGWLVARIDQRRVHLWRGDESEWLTLSKPPSMQTSASEPLAFKELASASDTDQRPGSID